jgi:hypothetical protein
VCRIDNEWCSGELRRGYCRRHYDRITYRPWVPMEAPFQPHVVIDREKVFELRSKGLYQYQIADILGCSQAGVCLVLKGRRQNED